MFDAHCHLDVPRFEKHQGHAMRRARSAGIEGFIVAGVDPPGWRRQRDLADSEPDVFFTIGLHPWHVATMSCDRELSEGLQALQMSLETMAGPKLIGLGECGLDRAVSKAPAVLQRQVTAMLEQLKIAKEHDLPLVLHIVRAHGLALDLLAEHGVSEAGGMVHSFSGSAEVARAYQNLGLHISFSTGIFRGSPERARSAIRAVAPERLLIETDSPDQAPPESHGFNEPCNLKRVLRTVAAARGDDESALAQSTTANVRRLFRLPGHGSPP